MDNYQDNFSDGLATPAYGQEQTRPGWFKRNWLWFIPLIILLPVFCCCGGGGALMWFGISEIQNIPPYQDSLTAAQSNADVQLALGSPIETGGFMGFPTDGSNLDIQYNTNGTTFIGHIPITGPNGNAKIYVEANSTDSVNWIYTSQEVQLNDGTIIDLLPAGSGATDTSTGELIDTAVDAIEQSLEERGLTPPNQK